MSHNQMGTQYLGARTTSLHVRHLERLADLLSIDVVLSESFRFLVCSLDSAEDLLGFLAVAVGFDDLLLVGLLGEKVEKEIGWVDDVFDGVLGDDVGIHTVVFKSVAEEAWSVLRLAEVCHLERGSKAYSLGLDLVPCSSLRFVKVCQVKIPTEIKFPHKVPVHR